MASTMQNRAQTCISDRHIYYQSSTTYSIEIQSLAKLVTEEQKA